MNETRETIVQIVHDAIADINTILPTNEKIALSESTILFGKGSELDSLNLVNFIVSVEEMLETRFGKPISLLTTEATSADSGALSTYASLLEFLTKQLGIE